MVRTCVDIEPMGKLFSPESLYITMDTETPRHSLESNPRLLESLAILNQISNAINHISSDDSTQNALSLQLIVDSAIRVVPGSSAVIYTYDQNSNAFEKESRVSAEPDDRKSIFIADQHDDAPRSNGIGVRVIQRRQRAFSYLEPDLDVHPYHAALGVKAVAWNKLSVFFIFICMKSVSSHISNNSCSIIL